MIDSFVGAVLSADRHKRSIANGAVGRKDLINFETAVASGPGLSGRTACEIRSSLSKTKRAGRQFREGIVSGRLQSS
jgi:hypothetical protein